jgi:hypothetical protein
VELGGAKTFTCSESQMIDDVAKANGFTEINGHVPCFVFRGRVLSPIFSLHWHRVRDGDTILVHLPKSRTYSPPIAKRNFFSKFSTLMEATTLAEIEAGEAARIADRDYANWEMLRSFPRLLAAMLSARRDGGAERRQHDETVIAPSAGISDAPLPTQPRGFEPAADGRTGCSASTRFSRKRQR